jgi:GH15 family glucan-1,4-alpha-glucosidase
MRADVRTDGYLPIEDYGVIGDSRSIALVGVDGTIDWMCIPELDSPSAFAAVLDPERGGRFELRPSVPFSSEQHYLERTNVLETTFHTEQGVVRVTDAMTIDNSQAAPWRELVRRIEGVSGRVPMTWRFEPRFDFGRRPPRLTRHGEAIVARDGYLQVGLQAWDCGLADLTATGVSGGIEIVDGAQAMLAMTATEDNPLPLPKREAVQRRLAETVEVWRSWISRHSYAGAWTDTVERSLLAIRLLADARTGAIAAAGTLSLPEVVGGKRNYDYRYGWVRDLSFTLEALMAVDMQELVQGSVTWLLSAVGRTHPRVDPLYRLGGEVLRSQTQIEELSGYRRTQPVHLGNGAGSQLQLGGFGDLLETVHQYVLQGHVLSPSLGERLADHVDLLCAIWRTEDAGLWELGQRAHYGTSKLGCWVAVDRLLDLVERGQVPPRHVQRWRRARDEIHHYIETQLFSEVKSSYRFKAGSDELDCGTLLAARRRFGDVKGPRMNGTIDAIRRELLAEGPLFYRYSGMQDEENAFIACSFWMVEALALAGRADEAAELMDGIVGLGSRLGLYSEEMEPGGHAMRGNFPQALTHLSLISAAAALGENQGGGESTRRRPTVTATPPAS